MSIPTRITFKHISSLFRAIIEKDKNKKVLLGRWALSKNKNTNLVVDYSNEDHCGTCSQYVLEKQEDLYKIKATEEMYRYDYEYLSSNTEERRQK